MEDYLDFSNVLLLLTMLDPKEKLVDELYMYPRLDLCTSKLYHQHIEVMLNTSTPGINRGQVESTS